MNSDIYDLREKLKNKAYRKGVESALRKLSLNIPLYPVQGDLLTELIQKQAWRNGYKSV